jgi:hypothetical protein
LRAVAAAGRLAGWLGIIVLGLGPPLLREANSDVAWQLYLAIRTLRGEAAGLIEVNPPLITWISLPAAGLHLLTGYSVTGYFILLVGLLAGASLLAAHRLLPAMEPDSGRRHVFLLAAGLALLVFPRLDFAEREHLAAILCLPFIVLAAGRLKEASVSPRLGLLVGLAGGMGFSLKPHFLIPWGILELTLLPGLKVRTFRRPELWALVGFGVFYAATILLFDPGYISKALELAPIYHLYIDNGYFYATGMAGPWLLFLAVAALALWSDSGRDPLVRCLAATFAGFLAAAILQRKGFSYHYVAAAVLVMLLLVRGWQIRTPPSRWIPSTLILRGGFLILPVLPLWTVVDAARELSQPEHRRYRLDASYLKLLPEVKRRAGGETIFVFSTNPNAGWPLTLDANARWAFRYMCLWPLVALYDAQVWSRDTVLVKPVPYPSRTGFERRFSDELMEDLSRHRPSLIAVLVPDPEERRWGGSRRFDYLQYFGSDPRFQAFLRDYQEAKPVGTYRLWVRSDSRMVEPQSGARDRTGTDADLRR